MLTRVLQVALIAFAGTRIQGVRADCYSRDKNTKEYRHAGAILSCGKGTNNCCQPGDSCGSNLLCRGQDEGYGVQYCVDKDWTNCTALAQDNVDGGVGLMECDTNVFCWHEPLDSCCTDGSETKYVNPRTGEVRTPDAKDADANDSPSFWSIDSAAVSASLSTIDGLPSTTSSNISPTTSSETTSSLSNGAAISTSASLSHNSATFTTPIATTTPTTSDRPKSSTGITAGAGAGIGVGCTAAVAGIAVLAWLFLRERRKRKALQAQTAQLHNAPIYEDQIALKTDMTGYAESPMPYHSEQERPRYEMDEDEDRARHEMDHERPTHELG